MVPSPASNVPILHYLLEALARAKQLRPILSVFFHSNKHETLRCYIGSLALSRNECQWDANGSTSPQGMLAISCVDNSMRTSPGKKKVAVFLDALMMNA